MLGKLVQIVELVEVGVHFVPVYVEVPVSKHVAKSGQRRHPFGQVGRENSQLPLPADCPVVISRLGAVFERDDAAADVDATLRGYFEITFGDIPEVGVLLEVTPRLLLKGT